MTEVVGCRRRSEDVDFEYARRMWSLLAVAVYTVVVFPLSAAAVGVAIGRAPSGVSLGVGPALASRRIGAVMFHLAPIPGAWVKFPAGEDTPAWLYPLPHLPWAVALTAAAATWAPGTLRAAGALLVAWLTMASADHGPLGALGVVWRGDGPAIALVVLAALVVFNVALGALQTAGRLVPPVAWGAWVGLALVGLRACANDV